MRLRLRATTVTHVGLVRANNEDSAHAGSRLVALADGIGGMPAGELASDVVVQALAALDQSLDESPDQSRTGVPAWSVTPEAGEAPDPVDLLLSTVEAANRQIHELSEADVAKDGMGTTVTALMLAGEEVALINVGDSRCYLERGGELLRLTRDDTFVQALVDQGVLTPDQARYHPRRSIVTQALQGLDYQASSAVRPAEVGDRYLLCSDGLSDVVSDEAIGLALRTVPDLDECAQSLIRLALEAGASDNVTVVVADIAPADD
jgi:serine/threonine protein phosphatase PrpC